MRARVLAKGLGDDGRAAQGAAVAEVGGEDEVRETCDAEDVAAVELHGSVDRVAGLPDVVVEGFLADGAGSGVRGDGFDFDGGGCEEEVEMSGGCFQVGERFWGDGHCGGCLFGVVEGGKKV